MRKSYKIPTIEIIKAVSTPICAGSPPREDGTGNYGVDEAKGNFFSFHEEYAADNEWPRFNAWED